jgi:2-polyprenyl-3-methyl-5-hydroxy-6-metoxy-1,4-benzoquinol methylase
MSNKSNLNNRCGFCTAKKSFLLYQTYDIFENQYTLNKCQECNAVFLAPRPTKETLNKAYDSSYYGEKEEKFSSPMVEKVLDYFRSGRARRVSRQVPRNGKILDVGCGNGRFLKYLLRFGPFELYGTEMEGNSAKRASRISEIKLKTGLLETTDFPEFYFDAVCLFHVFEHLTEPKETLTNIAKIVKPGGIAVFSFPNINSFQAKWFKGKWLHLDPPRHLFFFKPEDFEKLMLSYGFAPVKKHYVSMEQNPFGMVQSILNCFQNKREVLFESMKGNKNYLKNYSKLNLLFQKIFFASTMPLFIVTDFMASIFGKSATIEFVFRKK